MKQQRRRAIYNRRISAVTVFDELSFSKRRHKKKSILSLTKKIFFGRYIRQTRSETQNASFRVLCITSCDTCVNWQQRLQVFTCWSAYCVSRQVYSSDKISETCVSPLRSPIRRRAAVVNFVALVVPVISFLIVLWRVGRQYQCSVVTGDKPITHLSDWLLSGMAGLGISRLWRHYIDTLSLCTASLTTSGRVRVRSRILYSVHVFNLFSLLAFVILVILNAPFTNRSKKTSLHTVERYHLPSSFTSLRFDFVITKSHLTVIAW